jgi:hypothetical protein
MTLSKYTGLVFHTSLSDQLRNVWYSYGRGFDQPCPQSKVLPFQIVREASGAAISELVLVRVSDGVEADVLSEMSLSGLEVVDNEDGTENIIYPGTLDLSYDSLGGHYIRMSDGSNVWYSDEFCFLDRLVDLIRIDYFHLQEKFCIPGGALIYRAPYKGQIYLRTDIAKPGYGYEEKVVERLGRVKKLVQVSFKRHRFNVVLPEHLIDVMRLVQLHDVVEIFVYRNERTYEVDELEMNDPEWTEFGDVASVTFEFKTDTVVVVGGHPVDSNSYVVEPSDCIPVNYKAVGDLVANTKLYNNGQYLDSGNVVRSLEEDDYVVVQNLSLDFVLEQWNGSGFDSVALVDGDVVFSPDDQYWIASGGVLVKPRITSYDDLTNTVEGIAIPGVLTKLWAVTDSGNEFVGAYTDSELSGGVVVSLPVGTNYLFLEAQSSACGAFAKSNLFRIGGTPAQEGIDFWAIGDDFIIQ